MRTTLEIDDDVLLAARAIARRDASTIGAVVSGLARKGLDSDPQVDAVEDDIFCGFRPLPKRGRPVTNELIDRLREEGPH